MKRAEVFPLLGSLVLHATLLGLVFLGIIRVYLIETGFLGMLHNSDLVHPFLLAGDILADPTALLTWRHPPAWSFFPDVVLAAVLVAVGVPAGWQPLVYAACLAALLCLAAGAALRVAGGTSFAVGAWAYALLLCAFGLLILLLGNPPISASLLIGFVAAFIHSGPVLMTILALACFLRAIDADTARWPLILLLVICAAATFSDLLFVAWFVFPAVAVAILLARFGHSGRQLRVAWQLGLVAAVTYGLERFLNPSRADRFRLHKLYALDVDWLGGQAGLLLETTDIPTVLALVLLIALIARCAWLVFHLKAPGAPQRQSIFELFLGAASCAAFAAPLLTGYTYDGGSRRYFIAALALPLLWLAHLFLTRWITGRLLRAIVIAGPVVALAAPAWYLLLSTALPTLPRQAATLRCLATEGRDAGFGDYWDAKSLMHASERKLHVVALKSKGDPHNWNANKTWLHRRSDNGLKPRFDFILPERLNPDAIRLRYGPPTAELDCDDVPIWLYDAPLDTPKRATPAN